MRREARLAQVQMAQVTLARLESGAQNRTLTISVNLCRAER